MANFEIPQGFVHIPRYYSNDRNQAAELLEAAETVGADPQTSVVSVSDGYHVRKKVAKEWAKNYEVNVEDGGANPDEGVERDEDGNFLVNNSSLAGAEILGEAGGVPSGDEGDDSGSGEPASGLTPEPQNGPTDAGQGEQTQVTALGVTAENSNAEIDAYAADQKPPVDLSSAKNRVEKIALLEAARQSAANDNPAA